MNGRKIEENVFKGLMCVSTLTVLACLLLILATVVVKGASAMNLAMITQIPKGGYYLGKEGGILNAIAGSFFLAGGATILALLMSLPIVFYLNVYARKDSAIVGFFRFSLDVLWGVPSIVYGAFGFTIMIFLGLKTSLLAGIIAVSFLILPVMSRAMDEAVRMVPGEMPRASFALGATRLETALKVIAKQALPGILTAVLIAFGRAVGDAASVIFTAGYTDYIPDSLFRPAATLPLAIFFQLSSPFPEVRNRAYASAFILTVIILTVSITARILGSRFTNHRVN